MRCNMYVLSHIILSELIYIANDEFEVGDAMKMGFDDVKYATYIISFILPFFDRYYRRFASEFLSCISKGFYYESDRYKRRRLR